MGADRHMPGQRHRCGATSVGDNDRGGAAGGDSGADRHPGDGTGRRAASSNRRGTDEEAPPGASRNKSGSHGLLQPRVGIGQGNEYAGVAAMPRTSVLICFIALLLWPLIWIAEGGIDHPSRKGRLIGAPTSQKREGRRRSPPDMHDHQGGSLSLVPIQISQSPGTGKPIGVTIKGRLTNQRALENPG